MEGIKRGKIALLAMEASNAETWRKNHGRKSLAEVLSDKGLSCEELCRLGVAEDVAVELSARQKVFSGTCGKYSNKLPSATAKVRKEVVKSKSKRKTVVLRKKSGEVQTLLQKGDKFVVKGGKDVKAKTASKKTTITFNKSKKVATSKKRVQKLLLNNGMILKRIYFGNELVSEVYSRM